MNEAFQFAGYDAKFVLGDEGHNMKHGAAIMPDALRWLWRGYLAPIVVKEPAALEKEGWDPRGKVYSTVWASKGWEAVEGPNRAAADAGKNCVRRRRVRWRRRQWCCAMLLANGVWCIRGRNLRGPLTSRFLPIKRC